MKNFPLAPLFLGLILGLCIGITSKLMDVQDRLSRIEKAINAKEN